MSNLKIHIRSKKGMNTPFYNIIQNCLFVYYIILNINETSHFSLNNSYENCKSIKKFKSI